MSVELFPNIPQTARDAAKFIVDLALSQPTLPEKLQLLTQYASSCINEEERNFFNFYVGVRLTELQK